MTQRQAVRIVLVILAILLAVVLAAVSIFGHPTNAIHLLAWGLIADSCALLLTILL